MDRKKGKKVEKVGRKKKKTEGKEKRGRKAKGTEEAEKKKEEGEKEDRNEITLKQRSQDCAGL
jgi:hypothetical protein